VDLWKDRIVGVGGRTGFGKSSLARQLVAAHRRVVILEPSDRKSEYPDTERFYAWPDLLETMRRCGPHGPRQFRVALACGTTYFPQVLRLAWACAPCLVVIEEMSKYFGPDIYYPARDPVTGKVRLVAVPREFVEICERGRHAGRDGAQPVGILGISQAPAFAPRVFRQEMARFYSFRLTAEEDRRWLKGFPGAREAYARTAELQQFEYLNIDADGEVTNEKTTP
jgi:hypothetical protein